jgi:AraC-like DNA-binding protein
MIYREYQPSPAIEPLVRCFWTLWGRATAAEPQPVFPDGCTDLVFHFGDAFSQQTAPGTLIAQPDMLYAGQMDGPAVIRPGLRVGAFGIRFKPSAARTMIGGAQSQWTNRISQFDPLWMRRLREQMGNVRNDEERVAFAEAALCSAAARFESNRVDNAVAEIVTRAGQVRIADVADQAGLSARHLERTFEDHVGISAKLLARIVRFQRALRLRSSGEPWAGIAADCGYHDQAHLIRDFRAFTGATPSACDVVFLQDTNPTSA